MQKIKMFLIIKDQSERVKGKNFRDIGGLPLHEYFMTKRKSFDVYIDTDSQRILTEYSNKEKWPNVKVYSRYQEHIDIENSGSESPAPLMIKRFLNEYVTDENEPVITSHITSPFLEDSTVLSALKKVNEFDSVSSVEDVKEFCVYGENGNVQPINFDNRKIVKTQSLIPVKVLNGAFFILKKKVFMENGNRRISDKHYYHSLSKLESIDIDTEFDLTVAQNLAKGEFK
jgi:CMP-N-acetylneuraminic acid synthetase